MADTKSNFPVVERKIEQKKRQSQISVAPTAIHQRHLFEGYIIIPGLAADRPETGETETKAYFATDSGEFSVWDGTAWLSVTLT